MKDVLARSGISFTTYFLSSPSMYSFLKISITAKKLCW